MHASSCRVSSRCIMSTPHSHSAYVRSYHYSQTTCTNVCSPHLLYCVCVCSKAKVFTVDSGNNVGEILMHNLSIISVSYRKQRPYRIVTGSEDLTVNYYEGPPFKYVQNFKGHTRYPNCVRYSPNGDTFVSVGADSKICVFDGKTGAPVKEIEGVHSGSILSFSWSPDSKSILTASADRTCKIVAIPEGNVTTTFTFGDNVNDQQVAALWTGDYLLSVFDVVLSTMQLQHWDSWDIRRHRLKNGCNSRSI